MNPGLAIIVWVCTSGPNPVCPAEPHEIAVMDEGTGGFGPVTPYTCMGPSVQLAVKQYEREHPGLKIKRWTCGNSRRGQVAKI